MVDSVTRLRAALEGRYRIERELGEGGMAVVYLAHDLKHDRDVAIKLLKPELAAAVGDERFLREIRTLATLSHPHILPLHDSGAAAGLLYYVMPFIDGESLQDRLDREHQLPLDEALRLTTEVAEALALAHERGVVHRDIKPANIMLSAGHALVTDFGVAAAVDAAGGEKLTRTGIVVGTPAYMSPEQSAGETAIDGRSDVYSLGCVLYEMLAGAPPFAGSTPQALLARHAMDPVPSIRTVRSTVPSGTERVILKAMAKVPADRFTSAAQFAAALKTSETLAAASVGRRRTSARFAAVGGVAAVAFVAVYALSHSSGPDPPEHFVPGVRRPLTSYQGWEMGPSWSPDGSTIAYSHIVNASGEIALLSLGAAEPLILTHHPADNVNPRWSPDGSRIAFVSDRGRGSDIYLIPATGGPERKLVETHIPILERAQDWFFALGATPWSPDGTELVFSRIADNGEISLWKVDLETLSETRLTVPPSGGADLSAAWSHDGERIVFSRRDATGFSLWQVPSGGRDPEPVLDDKQLDMMPAWSPDDLRIAFVSTRSGAINLWEMVVETGSMSQVTSGIGNDAQPVYAPDGSIAYANWGHEIDLYQMDPDAPEREHQKLTSVTGSNFGGRISPDGTQILYFSDRGGLFSLWRIDRATGQHQRLKDTPSNDKLADWSPDGREVVFVSNRNGAVGLWIMDVETGAERPLTDQVLPMTMHPAEAGGPRWSPDGERIGYLAPTEGGNAVWTIRPDGSRAEALTTPGALGFSWYEDGHRIVYTRLTVSGRSAVELRALHLDTGEDRLLISGPIAEVEASPTGRRLSFVESTSHFMMNLHVLDLRRPPDARGLPEVAGEPYPITFGNGVWHVHNGGWAPDGRSLVYSRDRDYGDIHLIEPAR